MLLRRYCEVIWAMHHSFRVYSDLFKSRGGVLLLGPPGNMKTTILNSFEDETGFHPVSDITSNSLLGIRNQIISGRIHTVAVLDLNKIYERKGETANNIMGNLRALMDEGFTQVAHESKVPVRVKARALVLAASTSGLWETKYQEWAANGLGRRFIHSHFKLRNKSIIARAIFNDEPIRIGTTHLMHVPEELTLPLGKTTITEQEKLVRMLALGQMENDVQLIALRKALVMLNWKYKDHDMKEPLRIISEFSESFHKEGLDLDIDGQDMIPVENKKPSTKKDTKQNAISKQSDTQSHGGQRKAVKGLRFPGRRS